MSEHTWAQEHLDAYLAGDLTADECASMDRHSATCEECRRDLAEARHLSATMDRLFASARPDPRLEERVIRQVRAEPVRRARKPMMWRFVGAAAAVLVLAMVGAIAQAIATDGKLPFALPKKLSPVQMATGISEEKESAGEGFREPFKKYDPAPDERSTKDKFGAVDPDIANATVRLDALLKQGGVSAGQYTELGKLHEQQAKADKAIADGISMGGLGIGLPGMGQFPGMGMPGMGMGGLPPVDPKEVGQREVPKGYYPVPPGLQPGRPATEAGYYERSTMKRGEKGKEDLATFDSPKATREGGATGEGKPGDDKSPIPFGDQGQSQLKDLGKELLTAPVPTTTAPPANPVAPSYFQLPVPGPALPPGKMPPPLSPPAEPSKPAGDPVGTQKVPGASGKGAVKKPEVPEPPEDTGRKIIRTGLMEFEIDSFYGAVDKVHDILKAKTKGGFISTVNSDKLPNGKMRGSIVVRMPPQYLDDFLRDLRDILTKTGELKSQHIGSQDVTKQYTDTESELRAARAVESRLIEIIKTGKGEIKDLIAAERELGVWRTKIEKMEGEIRYFNNQVSLSTVTITLYEKEIQAPSAIVITERIGMRVEVEDVGLALETATKAVLELKGRVTKSDLKQHSALQLEAILHAEISPANKDTFSAVIKKLGLVSHHDAQRIQQAEGGIGRPLDLKLRQNDVRFEIAIHDLVNVRPRITANLQIATSDVPEQFSKLRDAIAKMKGQLRVGAVNEQDKTNITAQLEFNVPTAAVKETEALIAELGAVLSRSNLQAPVTELSTTSKQGYTLLLRDFASIPPRQVASTEIATLDVPAYYERLLAAVRGVKGYIRTSQLNEQDKLNINAQVEFSVMTTDKPAIDLLLEGKQVESMGAVLSRAKLQAPMGGLATELKFGYAVRLRDFVSIPARQGVSLHVATTDVPTHYQKLLDVIKQAKGHIASSQLNEQDKQNITAVVDFSVMTPEKPIVDKFLEGKVGEANGNILSRGNLPTAPPGSLFSEQKYRYVVHLRDYVNIPPSKATELTIATGDVIANYAKLLKAIADAKGQLGDNKLNEQDRLNISAHVRFMIPSTEKATIDRLLADSGQILSRNNVQAPASELSTDRKFGFSINLRDLASIAPRETFTLQLVATDVQAAFRDLQDIIAKSKGLIQIAHVIEDNKTKVAAKLDFNVTLAEAVTIEKAIGKVGAVLSRTSEQIPATQLASDQKVGYQLTLRSTSTIPPRDTVSLKLEVKDVDAKVVELKDLVLAGKGRVADSTVDRQENGRVEAKLVFEIPLSSQDALIRQIKANGTLVKQKTERNPQVPENELTTVHVHVTLTGLNLIVPSDEGFGSYINSGLYLSFRIFAYFIMIIIVGLSLLVPWAMVAFLAYKIYARLSAPAVEPVVEVELTPSAPPAAADSPSTDANSPTGQA